VLQRIQLVQLHAGGCGASRWRAAMRPERVGARRRRSTRNEDLLHRGWNATRPAADPIDVHPIGMGVGDEPIAAADLVVAPRAYPAKSAIQVVASSSSP